jgi:butyrate kinase
MDARSEAARPRRILAVNPGSTSTKVALFERMVVLDEATIRHSDDELRTYQGRPILAQLDMRLAAVRDRFRDLDSCDAVVGRGGLLEPVPGGTYRIDDDVLADLTVARRGEHASNLGPFLARRIADDIGCPAYLVDPVSVDEWTDLARYTGLRGLERQSLSHALNSRAVARRHAAERGREYAELRLVVVHLGSGITVSAHVGGRMVDACNSMEEGPFAMDRAGGVPVMQLLELAQTMTAVELRRRLFGDGGIYSYLGTRDLKEVLDLIDAGDMVAAEVVAAMLYQVAKEAGAMAAVLEGRVDGVVVTGGMAHAARIAEAVTRSLAWIAPVSVYPGEDELRALAEGGMRILEGKEESLNYGVVKGMKTAGTARGSGNGPSHPHSGWGSGGIAEG